MSFQLFSLPAGDIFSGERASWKIKDIVCFSMVSVAFQRVNFFESQPGRLRSLLIY